MMNIEAKREKPPIIWHVLHIGNARQHLIQSKFDSIAPCDFWLFGYLKMNLEGMFFATLAEFSAKVKEIFKAINITKWVHIFDE
jgi:hypothetical protein